eukprot:IDg7957t1
MSELSAVIEREEQAPVRCARFRRQELWAFKPVWSPSVVTLMYLVVALVLIPLGVVIYTQSLRLMSTPLLRYDNLTNCVAENSTQSSCVVRIDIPRATRANRVFFYYGIINFYQNGRRYARSRSVDQLRGKINKKEIEDTCKPIDSRRNGTDSIVPCGLTAQSFFNDTFELCHDDRCTRTINVTNKNIAWAVDRKTLFKPSPSFDEKTNERITSEEFMVWMRIAPYRTWKKLHRRIQEPLQNRTYFMKVESNYPVQSFDGQKFVYLVETTWFGGPNVFLGLSCIVVGGASLLLAVMYIVRSRFAPEPKIPPESECPWNDDIKEEADTDAAVRRRALGDDVEEKVQATVSNLRRIAQVAAFLVSAS